MSEEQIQIASPEDTARSRNEMASLLENPAIKRSRRGDNYGAVFDVNNGDKNHLPGAIGTFSVQQKL